MNHGCKVVQAVVMVTNVLVGNGQFRTTVNKKMHKPIVTKFCTGDYIGLVNLCTNVIVGSNRLPGEFYELQISFQAVYYSQSVVFTPFVHNTVNTLEDQRNTGDLIDAIVGQPNEKFATCYLQN